MFSYPFIRVLGIFLMLYSGGLLPPIGLSIYYQDHEALHLVLEHLGASEPAIITLKEH